MSEEIKGKLLEKFQSSVFKSLANIPFLSLLVIIVGFIGQLIYYTNFKVPIKYFSSFSEIGILVFQNLLFSVIVFVIYNYFNLLYQKNIFVRHLLSIKKAIPFVFISLILVFILGYFTFKDSTKYTFFILSFSFFPLAAAFLLMIIINLFHGSLILLKKIFFVTTVFLVPMMLYIKHITTEIKDVEHGKFKGTYIVTTDSTYRSNDSTYFIGKTEKFVFQYNKFDSTTSIIPVESIKRMVIKSK